MNAQRRVVLLAPATVTLGAGHAIRAAAVGQALHQRGWRVALLADPEARRTLSGFLTMWDFLDVVDLADGAEATRMHALRNLRADLAIIDDWRSDAGLEAAIGGEVGRLAVFDDFADRPHACDVLIDVQPYRRPADYDGLVLPRTRRLIGLQYMPIRREFLDAGAHAAAGRREPGRLLVTFGMANTATWVALALRAIRRSGIAAQVDVALSSQSAAASELVPLLEGMRDNNVTLWPDHSDMAGLMARAGLAIGVAGVTAMERCVARLPAIHIITDERQRQLAATMASAPGQPALLVEANEVVLAEALLELTGDPLRLAAMGRAAGEFCDGLGADRIADVLSA
jgi:spore coat polysaccharide biosynthesis predicted glycosyltransferase SpsG